MRLHEFISCVQLEDTAWKYGVHIVIQKIKRENRGSKSPITQYNGKSPQFWPVSSLTTIIF